MGFPSFIFMFEFNKQFFEAALGKHVDVALKQSIINGGDCCEFEVKIAN